MKLESSITTEYIGNIHPGEVLSEEFLKPMGITAYRLSKEIEVPQIRISEIIRGKRSISVDTAIRLAYFFDTTVSFWIGLQMEYDMEEAKRTMDPKYQKVIYEEKRKNLMYS